MLEASRFVRNAVAHELQPALMDSYLESLANIPENPARRPDGEIDPAQLPVEAIRVRKWGERRASPSAIEPDQVVALRRAVPRYLFVAWEIEEPWERYTDESVETLGSNGVKRLSVFMEHVWRADERRHAAIFKAAWHGVTGNRELQGNPNDYETEFHGARALRRHLFMRTVAELGAGATYVTLASHTRGPLEACISNVAGDEFRHLAVFWAAAKWWLGESGFQRVLRTCSAIAELAWMHHNNRTGLQWPTAEDTVIAAQMCGAMALSMKHLLAWEKTLTPTRLQDIFGPVPARLPDPPNPIRRLPPRSERRPLGFNGPRLEELATPNALPSRASNAEVRPQG